MNRPVLNWEFGIYDDNAANANYAGVKDGVKLCEEQAIPWNVHWFEQYTPFSSWQTYLTNLCGTYRNTNQTPLPFNPKPFNLLNYTVAMDTDDNGWGAGIALLEDTGQYIALQGPCSVRVRVFDCRTTGWADERGLTNFVGDSIVTVNAGKNLTITTDWGMWKFVTPYS
jgi:hypothetical protein